RINARAKIDSSRGKNIRGPASLTTHGDAHDAAVGASFLTKIRDLQEAIFRNCDCQRRSCNDLALEYPGKNQARIQEKEGSQPPTEVHFVRHMLRRHRPNEILYGFCRNISRNYSVYSGHLLGRSPIKAESWRELCQIVRHLGSEMIRNARLRQHRPRGAAALDL